MAVGPEAFFVRHCYSNWITAALPQFLPDAMNRLGDVMESIGRLYKQNAANSIDWLSIALLPADTEGTVDEILRNKKAAFPDLIKR